MLERMNILVFNVGSTTLKFACINVHTGERLTSGIVDRIGQSGGDAADHLSAANIALDRHSEVEIAAIGHRLVQGGVFFSAPTLVDSKVLDDLAKLDTLAPLHNPPARAVVEAIDGRGTAITQVLVFDTAYFTTLPPRAYRYAISDEIYRDYNVRRYGAHGTSHQYVTKKALEYLCNLQSDDEHVAGNCQNDNGGAVCKRIVSLHLGGGASATASIDGVAVETSMGMTPLEGLVMATRSGDIDPAVVIHLVRNAGMSIDDVDQLLNKRSGLVGMCGDVDMRTILQRLNANDASAALAIDIYVHRLQKYIGSYLAILGGLDALVFTAGVGEHAAVIRQLVVEPLGHLGIKIDLPRNSRARPHGKIVDLTAPGATVRTLVVPTDEELAIAGQVASFLADNGVLAH
jgi:acetate kinase